MILKNLTRIAALTVVLTLTCSAAPDTQPADPDLGTYITGAAAFDGRLWLMGESREKNPPNERDNGVALVSFSLSGVGRMLHFARGVFALHKSQGHLWVLYRPDARTAYSLEEWRSGAFVPVAHFKAPAKDKPLAIADMAGQPVVISMKSVRVLSASGWHVVDADDGSNAPPFWGYAAAGAPRDGSALYIGLDRGEWGGGLKRIDLGTGKVENIESDARTDAGFGTILSSGLDPVNGIIADPKRPDCIIAAIGLVHFESSGRILRICGRDISVVMENKVPAGNHFDSEAFFGVVPTSDGFWAVGNDGIHRFTNSGDPTVFKFSKFVQWNGLWIDREAPGVIVLLTDMNSTFSLSGETPIIIPLDDQKD